MLAVRYLPLLPLEPPPNIKSNSLKAKDIESIRLFTNNLLSTRYSSSFFLQFLYSSGTFCLFLTRSLNIIASISGKIESLSIGPRQITGHIYTLAVDNYYRRLGLGSRLVDELRSQMIMYANRAGMTLSSFSLDVMESNVTARKFYSRLGFRDHSFLRNYYGDQNAVKMVQALHDTNV